jgi:hypothetical protein
MLRSQDRQATCRLLSASARAARCSK